MAATPLLTTDWQGLPLPGCTSKSAFAQPFLYTSGLANPLTQFKYRFIQQYQG